jgi:hypothetical protein
MECTFNNQKSEEEEEQPEWNENIVEVGTGTSILPHPNDASTLFFVTSSGKIIRYSRLDSSSEEIGVLEDYSSPSSNSTSSTSPPCSSSSSPASTSAPSAGDPPLQRLLRNTAVLPSQNTPTHPFFVVSDPQGVLKMYNSHSRSWEVNESWHKCLLTHSSLVYDPTSHSLVYIANDSSWKLIAIR